MPRLSHADTTGRTQHVTQRGNNAQITFASDMDRAFYLECLEDAADNYCCEIHAYVLMANHVHLLLTPRKPDSVARLMQSVGRCYVQHVNCKYHRTGALWEGRHETAPVDSDAYVLRCQRYIELNPVRAGLVGQPAQYRWSSHGHNAEGRLSGLIKEHPLYLALGATRGERAAAYRELFSHALDPEVIDEIRKSTRLGLVIGHGDLKAEAEAALKRQLMPVKRDRLLKSAHGGRDPGRTLFAEGH